MKIKLKLYATLQEYLPDGTRDHTTELEVRPDCTPNLLIGQLMVPVASAHLVLLNGIYLDAAKRDQSVLSEGDCLAVWPPVAGG